MNIKRNIIFSLESRKKDGLLVVDNVPIRMRVIYHGCRVEFTTGYRIDAAKWEADRQRVRNGCMNKLGQNASEINTTLQSCYAHMQSLFKAYEVKGIVPSPGQLKEDFSKGEEPLPPVETEDAQPTKPDVPAIRFGEAFGQFMQESSAQHSWTHATWCKFRSTRHHLENYDARLELDSLDESRLLGFVHYLRDSLDLRNNTIDKQVSYLKWFLRWCRRKGYPVHPAFEDFHPKLRMVPKKVIFLDWDELSRLRSCEIPASKPHLEHVRDVFLFSCFTGLRYSDVYNLRPGDIKDGRIELTTVKTSDCLTIELNDHSRGILEKYTGMTFKGGKALPVISNQRMNDHLKELGELAVLDEPVREIYYKGNRRIDQVSPKYSLLSTHAGRRTFICNALSLGIPAHVVMKWTGHSDYKAMKPYIDVADQVRAGAMEKFNSMGRTDIKQE